MATKVAFALAGLGGFNAHGAGFLTAASRYGVVPDLVTATSGQIIVLADWLRQRDLKAGLIDPERQNNPLAQVDTALFGYPGVFKPAYWQIFSRWLTPPSASDSAVDIIADRMLPAQQYVSARPDSFFIDIADTFNAAKIGVVFNAYDLKTGEGVLYGNKTAQGLLPTESALPARGVSEDVHYRGSGRNEQDILPITPQAVKSALWLSLYGFEHMPDGRMDGAYHRACLVSELHPFDRVFVARPLANGWVGHRPPSNWFEVQDWQCEMWFSVGYKAEVDAMKRINDLIDAGRLKDDKFRKVDLVEIEPKTPAGFFNFFIERDKVFDQAFAKAEEKFKALGYRPVSADAMPAASGSATSKSDPAMAARSAT